MGVHNFDIIGLQEPWQKETHSFDHTGYILITPECDIRHRVSFYFREASIAASDICPRPDLSTSPDLLVVDLIVRGRRIHLVNLYNDCETRAGVGLLAALLARFGPRDETFAIMDSNSHHVAWDSLTLTPSRPEDFDLHDLLVSHPLTLVTPPDVPTHLPSGNVLDLGFVSPSLIWNINNVVVSSDLGLGSDHLPITYELDLDVQKPTTNRFNPDTMDVDKFLAVLRRELDRPLPPIDSQLELDDAVDLLGEALILALGSSTTLRRPSSHSRKWWTQDITAFLGEVRRAERWFRRHRTPSTRRTWLDARRALYRAIASAKEAAWRTFIRELERANVYDVLNRIRLKPRSVFPSLVDPVTGEVATELDERGRLLARSWFGAGAVEVVRRNERGKKDSEMDNKENKSKNNNEKKNNNGKKNEKEKNNNQDNKNENTNNRNKKTEINVPSSVDGIGTGAGSVGVRDAGEGWRRMEADEERVRVERRERMVKDLVIVEERRLEAVTDEEVDAAIFAGDPWKAPDSHGLQMGYIRRSWPVTAVWVRHIFKSSIRLGLFPSRLKSSNAIPTPKAGKKDKTNPKAHRPVEQHAEALAKPLERLVANRITFEAESRGILHESQFGGRPGRSTQQAADAYIHQARSQLDEGKVVSTLFFDLKGAFNGISHRVVAEEMAACGFPRTLIAWVLSFLDGHLVTIVLDGRSTVTFRVSGKGAPQGSALSVILFLLTINRLLRRLDTVNVDISWTKGFVDDVNFSTASRCPLENVRRLEEAGRVAKEWEGEDEACFESEKTELLHVTAGRADLSGVSVRFGGKTIKPSSAVKWIGLWLDKSLGGTKHIAARSASAMRDLNASMAVMHNSWGMRPLLIRDLIRTTVLPCADYGVASFLPLPTDAFKLLDRVNKSVARCITGAFRTAALAVLEKEAALLPAQLRIERDAMNTVAYYLTLPPSHCIRPLLRDAIASAPKSAKNASILHLVERIPGTNWPDSVPARGQRIRRRGTPRTPGTRSTVDFDSSLGLEPIVPVYAPPWATPLPVTTVILPKEDALAALEAALADERRRCSTWFTDGSLLEGRAGGAAVRVEDGKEMERVCVPLGDGQVCDGEMEGLVCATTKALKDNCHCVLCVADSQAALRGILSTKPRSGQHRAICYDKLVREALVLCPHLTILNLWTPAHIGTAGNELADVAAKSATEQDPDPEGFLSLTSIRRHIHRYILSDWNTRWKATKVGRALRYIDDKPPSLIPIALYSSSTLSRKISSSISQLRTGFSFLNAHRFKSHLVDSPSCPSCGASFETRAHYLLDCPAWEPFRQPLHDACKPIGLFGSLHLTPLLSHPALLIPVGKFVEATGRFERPSPPP